MSDRVATISKRHSLYTVFLYSISSTKLKYSASDNGRKDTLPLPDGEFRDPWHRSPAPTDRVDSPASRGFAGRYRVFLFDKSLVGFGIPFGP